MHISALLNLLRVKSTLIKRHRKAITPVLATIILIAITLIAGVAIAGFVFGLFGTSANSPAVGFVTSDVDHVTAAGGQGTWDATCAPSKGGDSWLQFKNSGGGPTSLVSMKLSYNGATIPANFLASCTVAAQATIFVQFSELKSAGPAANAGDTFSGSATLSNGATVPFSGTFI